MSNGKYDKFKSLKFPKEPLNTMQERSYVPAKGVVDALTQVVKPHEIVTYYRQFLDDWYPTGATKSPPTLDDFMNWLEQNPVRVNV